MSKKRNKPTASSVTRPNLPKITAELPRATADKLILALAALGMLITGYLSVVALTSATPLMCGAGSGCDLIQQSHWSRLFGIPVVILGLMVYALMVAAALIPAARMRRWRRLATLSVLGVAFSLYLTLIGLIELQAVCGWCLASLATLVALLVVVFMNRPPSAPGTPWLNWSMSHAALLLGVIGISHAYYAGLFSPRPEPQLQALAIHLKESGAQFYGASWCATCSAQKALFGGAAKDLPYVECSPAGRGGPFSMTCLNAGIQTFPTWIIRGRRYTEMLQVNDLAQRTGFKFDAAETATSAPPTAAPQPPSS